jgi:molecular chaperone Hsp33
MDTLVKAMTKNGAIRIMVINSTQTVQEAASRHKTLPTASAALGRTLSATAILGAQLKGKGESVTVQINGKGPLGTILCEANTNGELRGFVSNPDVFLINDEIHKLDVGAAVGKDGTLRVIRNTHMKADFTGTVELQTGEIGDDFAYYFTVSEQTPSAVSLGVLVGKDNEILAAGGLLIQLLPTSSETDLLIAEDVVKHLRPISEMIHDGMTPDEIALALFDEVEIMGVTTIQFKCSCSKDRLRDALKTIDSEEIELMIKEDKGAEITCHFCNTSYHFSEDELTHIHREHHE